MADFAAALQFGPLFDQTAQLGFVTMQDKRNLIVQTGRHAASRHDRFGALIPPHCINGYEGAVGLRHAVIGRGRHRCECLI